jgi:purine-binding chemotaxis protein CheW
METTAKRDSEQIARKAAEREGKYLTFSLAGEEYGIVILKVREIIGLTAITSMPKTPGYIKGVINLRGKVIPIADLRLKFGMEAKEYTDRTCIIVVEILSAGAKISMGVIVDSVSEVLNIREAEIEDAPQLGIHFDTGYILGMAKSGSGVKILLDIDQVLSGQEIREMIAA